MLPIGVSVIMPTRVFFEVSNFADVFMKQKQTETGTEKMKTSKILAHLSF